MSATAEGMAIEGVQERANPQERAGNALEYMYNDARPWFFSQAGDLTSEAAAERAYAQRAVSTFLGQTLITDRFSQHVLEHTGIADELAKNPLGPEGAILHRIATADISEQTGKVGIDLEASREEALASITDTIASRIETQESRHDQKEARTLQNQGAELVSQALFVSSGLRLELVKLLGQAKDSPFGSELATLDRLVGEASRAIRSGLDAHNRHTGANQDLVESKTRAVANTIHALLFENQQITKVIDGYITAQESSLFREAVEAYRFHRLPVVQKFANAAGAFQFADAFFPRQSPGGPRRPNWPLIGTFVGGAATILAACSPPESHPATQLTVVGGHDLTIGVAQDALQPWTEVAITMPSLNLDRARVELPVVFLLEPGNSDALMTVVSSVDPSWEFAIGNSKLVDPQGDESPFKFLVGQNEVTGESVTYALLPNAQETEQISPSVIHAEFDMWMLNTDGEEATLWPTRLVVDRRGEDASLALVDVKSGVVSGLVATPKPENPTEVPSEPPKEWIEQLLALTADTAHAAPPQGSPTVAFTATPDTLALATRVAPITVVPEVSSIPDLLANVITIEDPLSQSAQDAMVADFLIRNPDYKDIAEALADFETGDQWNRSDGYASWTPASGEGIGIGFNAMPIGVAKKNVSPEYFVSRSVDIPVTNSGVAIIGYFAREERGQIYIFPVNFGMSIDDTFYSVTKVGDTKVNSDYVRLSSETDAVAFMQQLMGKEYRRDGINLSVILRYPDEYATDQWWEMIKWGDYYNTAYNFIYPGTYIDRNTLAQRTPRNLSELLSSFTEGVDLGLVASEIVDYTQ